MDDDPIIDEKIMKEADSNDKRSDDDLHLRSTKKIIGYHIHTADGDCGHVSDFIFDDANWQIMYLVVDSHNWFGGKKYLIETGTVKEIQWDNSKVIVRISTDAIKDSPVFDESQFKYSRSAGALLVNSWWFFGRTKALLYDQSKSKEKFKKKKMETETETLLEIGVNGLKGTQTQPGIKLKQEKNIHKKKILHELFIE